jgi:hypothetical protein
LKLKNLRSGVKCAPLVPITNLEFKHIKLLRGHTFSSNRDAGVGVILAGFELLFVGYGRNVIAAARLCQVAM